MTSSTNHDIIKVQTKKGSKEKMTKFEKMAKRAELLERAYNVIIEQDKWDNYGDLWSDNPYLRDDRTEEHEFYLSIAKEIEKLL